MNPFNCNALSAVLAVIVLFTLISCGGGDESTEEIPIKQPATVVDSSATGLVFYYPPTDSADFGDDHPGISAITTHLS